MHNLFHLHLPAAKIEKPRGCAPPPATDAQTPECKETPGWKQQREKSHPEIQDTRKVLKSFQRTSPVTLFIPDQLSSAATVNTKEQNQPRLSQKAEEALPKILIGMILLYRHGSLFVFTWQMARMGEKVTTYGHAHRLLYQYATDTVVHYAFVQGRMILL